MEDKRRIQVAFTLLPFGKPGVDKALLTYAGTPEAVFDDPDLRQLNSLPTTLRQALATKERWLKEADTILEQTVNLGCRMTFYGEADYPHRLTFCDDAPLLLYYKGHMDLNRPHILSIVGTRKPTPAGRDWTESLVEGLAKKRPDLVVVSGLAYGIDIMAHTAALKHNLSTVAVLAHGLDQLYPAAHSQTARSLQNKGCLLSELKPGIMPEGWRFLQRNRIVAGISDACIVVESGERGGSLNTATRAFEYGRPVFSRPGRPTDTTSKGCNKLIKRLVANLADDPDGIMHALGWAAEDKINKSEPLLFNPLGPKDQAVYKHLSGADAVALNDLLHLTGLSIPDILAATMQLEMEGLIESLPGSRYRIKGSKRR